MEQIPAAQTFRSARQNEHHSEDQVFRPKFRQEFGHKAAVHEARIEREEEEEGKVCITRLRQLPDGKL
jgi:hypothetical protein